MMEPFTESGMSFGPYPKSDVFRIEKSEMYASVGKNIKIVDFILWRKNSQKKKVLFVEAKTNAPNPTTPPADQKEGFPGFREDISEKFIHSLDIFFSALLKRCDDKANEIPQHLDASTYSDLEYDIIPVLVIKDSKKEWLAQVRDLLNKDLISKRKIWKLQQILVLNEEMARDQRLIV